MADLKVTRRKLKDYTLDPRNANKGTIRGEAIHQNSVDEFGAARSVVADVNGVFLAGNKTAERLSEAGITDVIEIETDGTQLVVVKRPDLDITTERGQRYALFDNRSGELNLSWDGNVLAELQSEGVSLETFFDEDELSELLNIVPDYQSPGTDEQGRLNQKASIICPHCGREFIADG